MPCIDPRILCSNYLVVVHLLLSVGVFLLTCRLNELLLLLKLELLLLLLLHRQLVLLGEGHHVELRGELLQAGPRHVLRVDKVIATLRAGRESEQF